MDRRIAVILHILRFFGKQITFWFFVCLVWRPIDFQVIRIGSASTNDLTEWRSHSIIIVIIGSIVQNFNWSLLKRFELIANQTTLLFSMLTILTKLTMLTIFPMVSVCYQIFNIKTFTQILVFMRKKSVEVLQSSSLLFLYFIQNLLFYIHKTLNQYLDYWAQVFFCSELIKRQLNAI